MHVPWVLIAMALGYAFAFATRPLVLRLNRDSVDWQERSERYRLFFSMLPGYLLGIALGVVLILLLDH